MGEPPAWADAVGAADGAELGVAGDGVAGVGVAAMLGAGVGSVSTGPGVSSELHTYLGPLATKLPCGPWLAKNRK